MTVRDTMMIRKTVPPTETPMIKARLGPFDSENMMALLVDCAGGTVEDATIIGALKEAVVTGGELWACGERETGKNLIELCWSHALLLVSNCTVLIAVVEQDESENVKCWSRPVTEFVETKSALTDDANESNAGEAIRDCIAELCNYGVAFVEAKRELQRWYAASLLQTAKLWCVCDCKARWITDTTCARVHRSKVDPYEVAATAAALVRFLWSRSLSNFKLDRQPHGWLGQGDKNYALTHKS